MKNQIPHISFPIAVEEELAHARRIHQKPQNSLHEGYAVLLEELDEFWDEVRKKARDRDPDHIFAELVQIAAMAQRTAEDLVIPQVSANPFAKKA